MATLMLSLCFRAMGGGTPLGGVGGRFCPMLGLASARRRRRGSFFSLDRKETNLSAAKACLPLKTTNTKA